MDRDLAEQLQQTVEHAARVLGRLDDVEAGCAPAPGKWSPKQILGHLIDSAIVNHQRFAQATTPGGLKFGTYDQEHFVGLQRPADVSWSELLELWRLLNWHVARLVEHAPDETLARLLPEDGLERIAWKLPAPGEPATLEYFMHDYLGHLVHHLDAIVPGLADDPATRS